jgi:hypothetical protein
VSTHRVHSQLERNAKPAFEGRLKKAISDARGLGPFEFEVAIATHAETKGWGVAFADYSGAGQFDLLARKGSIEVEIECKATSNDTGRRLKRQELTRLGDLLLPTTQDIAETPGAHFFGITITNRLGKNDAELGRIVSLFSIAATQRGEASDEFGHVRYRFEDLQTWPDMRVDPMANDF